jgi:phosphatidylinositol alpha-1,6-mannosyltransferase
MDILISHDFLPKIGGAHMWLHEVYRRWATPVRVLTTRDDTDSDEARRQRGFDANNDGSLQIFRRAAPLDDINLLNWRCLTSFRAQLGEIARLRDDRITSLHTLRAFPEGFLGLLYKRVHPLRTRLVTYAHGEEILVAQTSRQLGLIAKWVYAGSDLIIANSENTKRMVLALCPRARVVCIHPGVDASAFALPAAEVAAFRSQWRWPAEAIAVATVARMEPRKNHASVIRAICELRRQGLPLTYVCAGDGQERESLVALTRECALEPWVRFPGAVTERDKRLIFAACDIHAMPSVRAGPMIEGFGIVFLEAAAAGKPSVCGNTGGQAEAVQDGMTGLVVDGSDHSQLIDAMGRLARDPEIRTRMGEAGRRWAAQNEWVRVRQRIVAEIGRAQSTLGNAPWSR